MIGMLTGFSRSLLDIIQSDLMLYPLTACATSFLSIKMILFHLSLSFQNRRLYSCLTGKCPTSVHCYHQALQMLDAPFLALHFQCTWFMLLVFHVLIICVVQHHPFLLPSCTSGAKCPSGLGLVASLANMLFILVLCSSLVTV